LAILDKYPFESARSIAERLCASHSTVVEHLHMSIGFRSFHLRVVRHRLTDASREKRKEHATAMLPFLYATKLDGWHHLVIDDESWFFFDTSSYRM
jgi:DNA-binding MarR family transcriptional regulator